MTQLPIIKNRHYAQASVRAERREQRLERRRRGEAAMPKRRWKKGHGNTSRRPWPSIWTPFAPDGTIDRKRLARQGFVNVGAMLDESLDIDFSTWFGTLEPGGVGPHIVEHVASGKRALCGGPGACKVCDEGIE